MPSNIHPALAALVVPIDSLVEDPRNARLHNARNIAAIVASLREFGQRKPIVVQAEGRIIRAGNGTLRAAVELGWTEIAALVVDEDEIKARAFAIADNRSGELAEWDFEELAGQLKGLQEAAFSLDDLGWNINETAIMHLTNLPGSPKLGA